MFINNPRILIFIAAIILMISPPIGAQDFRSVHDGVEYAELTRDVSGKTVKINLLRLDLTKVRLDVRHASDTAIGTEKTSAIAMRHGAVAAINAGFFRLDKSKFAGDAAGILMIDGSLWSESVNDRATLLITNNKKRNEVGYGHNTPEISVCVAS
jgi:exopolysaccharide biosynthesis protein